jgi:hypothetical protein
MNVSRKTAGEASEARFEDLSEISGKFLRGSRDREPRYSDRLCVPRHRHRPGAGGELQGSARLWRSCPSAAGLDRSGGDIASRLCVAQRNAPRVRAVIDFVAAALKLSAVP